MVDSCLMHQTESMYQQNMQMMRQQQEEQYKLMEMVIDANQ